ncbi:MAB_1171c family putative transporter [Streptomyces sp. NPDC101234]|uniref:MAB_1171c family putative transporter n=1 Tax=Streptomyces sp. NPDC101234 TaxID=3366138 RepID=UPI00380A6529
MENLTACLAALVFLVFAGHRLTLARGGGADPAQRDVAGFALCAGLAMLLNAPALLHVLERFLPAPCAELLLPWELKAAAGTFLALVALALDPRVTDPVPARRRRRIGAAAVVVQAAALGLFLASGVTGDGAYFVAAPGRGRVLAAYNVLFAAYLCWTLYVLARALVRHARRTGPGPLRTGLRLAALATATAMVWTLWTLDDAAADITTGRQGLSEDLLSTTLGMLTAVLLTAGATATLWGERITAPLRRLRARRAHRALEPLWAALHAELPEIALDPDAARRRPGLRQAEFARYRRVIEIRDGILALRPYQWAEPLDRAVRELDRTGVEAVDREAALEAVVIAAALENKRAGRPYGGTPDQAGPTPSTRLETVEDEAAWLVRVAGAFTRSPVVRDIRDRVRAQVTAD